MKTKLILVIILASVGGYFAGYKYAEYKEEQVNNITVDTYHPAIKMRGRFNDAVEWSAELRVNGKVSQGAHMEIMRFMNEKQYEYSSEQYDEFVWEAEKNVKRILSAHNLEWTGFSIIKEELNDSGTH